MATFKTDDGFVLRKEGEVWTDGDLTFESGADGFPVTDTGEPVDGDVLPGADDDPMNFKYCPNQLCGNDGEYGLNRKKCPFCDTPLAFNLAHDGTEGGSVQKELEDVAAFGMTPVGAVGTEFYRDPDDGTLNLFDRAKGIFTEVDNPVECYLTLAYREWLKAQDFALMSSEEVRYAYDLNAKQYAWLHAFDSFWDLVVAK